MQPFGGWSLATVLRRRCSPPTAAATSGQGGCRSCPTPFPSGIKCCRSSPLLIALTGHFFFLFLLLFWLRPIISTIYRTSLFLVLRGSPSIYVLPTPAPWRLRGREDVHTLGPGCASGESGSPTSVCCCMQGGTLSLRVSPLFERPGLEHTTVEKCTVVPVTDSFVFVSGRGNDTAWLELYIQQDTAYTKTCQNSTVDVGKWYARRHKIIHGHF